MAAVTTSNNSFSACITIAVSARNAGLPAFDIRNKVPEH